MEELESMLLNKDIDGLCEKYELYDFQAQVLVGIYSNINKSDNLKNNFLERINSGYYKEEYQVNTMAKNYLKNAILKSKDHGLLLLTSKCGLSEFDANNVINIIITSENAVNDLLSTEVDGSHLDVRINNTLNEILPSFLESYKGLNMK